MNNTPEIGVTNEKKRKAETKETNHVSKRSTPQQQEPGEEEQNIEEYIESFCKCAIKVATGVVELFNFYKQVPPEVMKTETMRKMQERVLQLLGINLPENKQSSRTSKQQDGDDPLLSSPVVINCMQELDKAIKAKRRWLITMEARRKCGRGISQESSEIIRPVQPAATFESNPLVMECIREMDKAIEAKRRFMTEMASQKCS